jgi:tetratricopeptide (TPR) repeat protein
MCVVSSEYLKRDIDQFLDIARLHTAVGHYYNRLGDISNALIHGEIAFSLADQADDNVQRNRALCTLSLCTRLNGRLREALEFARRAEWFASRIGNFQHETQTMQELALCLLALGNFAQAADICGRARQLVIAAGFKKTQFEINILDSEADVWLYKTAYRESRSIHEYIVQSSSSEKFPLFHGFSRVAIAAIDVTLGLFKSEAEVAAVLEVPRQIFTSRGYLRGLPICDKVLADFAIANGRTAEAVQIYEKCVHSFRGKSMDSLFGCMRVLGDITLRNDVRSTTHWATTYLAYGKTTASRLIVAWAFRLLGDIFREDGDHETSSSLFQIALEEFTGMDIYQGRAECLLRLADIVRRHGEHTAAREHLIESRRMFLKSGMVAEAEKVPIQGN